MSQTERERLQVLHEITERHRTQVEGARRLQLSPRQVRRLQRRVQAEGDRGVIHRLRGRRSNRKIPEKVQKRVLAEVRRRYADFGPTLAAEHLAASGVAVSRETLRQWMRAAGLWRSRRRTVRAIHVWRERRAAFGELVMMDSSPFRWLEDRGSHLQFDWIAAHSPQAKGRIERLFRTLQDRLVKEMRLRGIENREQANHYLESVFLPWWQQRFARLPRDPRDAHRRLEREHRLERILSIRQARSVSPDHTVSWQGQRWGLAREQVCAGLRGARAEIERRLDGSTWLRFRGRYWPLLHCPAAAPASVSPSGLRPPGLTDRKRSKPKPKYIPPPDHPWRTFLFGRKPDISTLR